jgi:hypothetical protein
LAHARPLTRSRPDVRTCGDKDGPGFHPMLDLETDNAAAQTGASNLDNAQTTRSSSQLHSAPREGVSSVTLSFNVVILPLYKKAVSIPLGILVIAGSLTVVGHAANDGPPTSVSAVQLAPTGSPKPAFKWEKCSPYDVPDAGLRAFRVDASSMVAFASDFETRRMVGRALTGLRKECEVSLDSAQDADPATYNDKTWVAATWTDDGINVMAIGHEEYHAESHPGRCAGTTPRQCRYATLIFLISHDSGRHFERWPGPPLAAVPMRQDGDWGRDSGFAQPSNIFAHGEFKYVFVRSMGGGAQPPATCLMRSPTPLDPRSWTIYDGRSFRPALFDPYRDPVDQRVNCAQIPGLNGMVWSVLTHQSSGALVALLSIIDPSTKKARLAITTSSEPVAWAPPTLIDLDLHLAFNGSFCSVKNTYTYPSLLDPSSPSRNFDTTGNEPLMAFTRIDIKGCRMTLDRDLIFVPVHFLPR